MFDTPFETKITSSSSFSARMEMQDYAVHKLASNALLPAQKVVLTVSKN